jgi:hypothetical protein
MGRKQGMWNSSYQIVYNSMDLGRNMIILYNTLRWISFTLHFLSQCRYPKKQKAY